MIRILLVDDDEDDFVVLQDLAREMGGHSIEWTSSYDEARRKIAKDAHDVYLLDYRLGERNGLDLLRESIASGVRAPFILLTGYGDEDIDLQAMREGASDYLVKTQLTAPLLERAIRYAIHGALALASLRKSEEGFRNLLDAAFEGILVHNASGKILQVNQAAANIFGLNRAQMEHRDLSEFLGPWQGSGETSANRLDGTTVRLEISSKPYAYAGEGARLTAIRDISQRKQLEAQILVQDRMASIGLLASSLAHEIGTPLGVVRGRAELLAEQLRPAPEARKNIDVILAQIDRISKLIHSLLNLARGDTATAAAGSVALDRVIQDVVDLVGHEFKRQGVRLESKLPDGEIAVTARAEQLHQVVLNLLVNSLHAVGTAEKRGQKGPFFARIQVKDEGETWSLRIQDNGCGISAENMGKLFRPFFTTKEIGVGTGLGLANSYRIIENAGGSISVESVQGKGTTFVIGLPKTSRAKRD